MPILRRMAYFFFFFYVCWLVLPGRVLTVEVLRAKVFLACAIEFSLSASSGCAVLKRQAAVTAMKVYEKAEKKRGAGERVGAAQQGLLGPQASGAAPEFTRKFPLCFRRKGLEEGWREGE